MSNIASDVRCSQAEHILCWHIVVFMASARFSWRAVNKEGREAAKSNADNLRRPKVQAVKPPTFSAPEVEPLFLGLPALISSTHRAELPWLTDCLIKLPHVRKNHSILHNKNGPSRGAKRPRTVHPITVPIPANTGSKII